MNVTCLDVQIVEIKDILEPQEPFRHVYVVYELFDTDLHQASSTALHGIQECDSLHLADHPLSSSPYRGAHAVLCISDSSRVSYLVP